MPNSVGAVFNRKVRSRIASGEIGIGSSNFVAVALPTDPAYVMAMTGFNISMVSADTQAKALRAYLVENRKAIPSDIVAPSVNDLSLESIEFYPFEVAAAAGGQTFLYTDRRTHPLVFNDSYSYSFYFDFAVGGPGTGDVRLDLTVFGIYESKTKPIQLETR